MGEAVLGGTPRVVWGLIALAITVIALAITATSANATTDRADYAAQVNPICASANAQSKQLYESFEQTFAQLKRKVSKLRGKKRDKVERRLDGLFFDFADQSLAVYYGELAQLRQVPPAPGDEGLVAEWLAARQAVLDLSSQSNAIERRVDRLFTRAFSDFGSLREFLRLQKKLKRLERQISALQAQTEPLYEKDIELGARLGAAYCVSEATGIG